MYIVTLKNDNIETQIHGVKEKLFKGNVVKGINVIDSFSFSILPSNAGFNKIFDYKTLVHVYNTHKNRDEFFGRVLYSASTMEESGLIYKDVVCESYLGFLCDSQQDYVEEKNWTVVELLQHIITLHNSRVEEYKRFELGNVTVTDNNDNVYIGIQRENTWNTIEEKLLDKLGGEIAFRVVNGVNYIDYVEKRGSTLTTPIKLSRNMKSITREDNPMNYVSRLIPLGAKLKTTDEEGNEEETEERLDISIVNNGLTYIESAEAKEAYGIRYATVTFDDVTNARTLLSKGQEYLAENNKVQVKYSINALDLSLLGLDINDFDVCNYHPIENHLLGIDDTARIIKKNIDICKETASTIEVGDNFKTLTDITLERKNELKDAINRIESAKNELKEYVAKKEKSLVQKIEAIDGSFFYIMYSEYEDGHVMTTVPDATTKYMGTCSTSSSTAPTDFREYEWALIRGQDGKDGTAGTNGSSNYFHVKYSNDGKTFTSNNGETLGDWMGTCVTDTESDPTDFDAYTWKKIVGEDGSNGIDGVDGKDGESCYFFVKYSDNSNGDPMTEAPTSTTKYMGTCSTSTPTAPTDYKQYTWTQCKGNDGTNGIAGEKGEDGKTQYLHIKYSDDGETFTANDGEELGAWIGTLVDFTEADSTNFDDYTWKKFTEEVDEELNEIRETIVEQHTTITNDFEKIMFQALTSYTETGDFETFKESTEATLKLLSDELTLKFTQTTEQLTNVNGTLQEQLNTITKYFTFDIDGLTIGQVDNPYKVIIDNDRYSMTVNGVEVMWIAGGKVYTPEIEVTKQFNLFGFIIDQDEYGNVNCSR